MVQGAMSKAQRALENTTLAGALIPVRRAWLRLTRLKYGCLSRQQDGVPRVGRDILLARASRVTFIGSRGRPPPARSAPAADAADRQRSRSAAANCNL